MRTQNEILKGSSSWVCCQIGAREHYAIPRALNRLGRLHTFFTERWNTLPNKLSSRLLPARLYRPIQTRFHKELASTNVVSFTRKSIAFEISNKFGSTWQRVEKRNEWFQKVALASFRSIVESNPGCTVFSYSYAAKAFFEIAKCYGCKTILGQIDPGRREVEIVDRLHNSAGLEAYQQPSEKYWHDWHIECELADAILVNSNWSKSLLVEQDIDAEKLHVVPLCYEPPVDEKQRNHEVTSNVSTYDSFTETRPLRVLFLGQVVARKGVVELLEAIDQLNQLAPQLVHWTFVGGGDQHLVGKLKQMDNVTYTDQVARSEVGDYFSNHDVFILPTHSDGFAITQLESLHFNLPVIASKRCGEVVADGVNGILLDTVSAASIAGAIQSILRQPSMLQDFRENIQSQFANRYALSDLASDLLKVDDNIRMIENEYSEGLAK